MSELDELRDELAEFAQPGKKGGRPLREERIIAGFGEIRQFVEKHGRAPRHGEGRDIFERIYAVRLDRMRALEECRTLLTPLDSQGLLAKDETGRRLTDPHLGPLFGDSPSGENRETVPGSSGRHRRGGPEKQGRVHRRSEL